MLTPRVPIQGQSPAAQLTVWKPTGMRGARTEAYHTGFPLPISRDKARAVIALITTPQARQTRIAIRTLFVVVDEELFAVPLPELR